MLGQRRTVLLLVVLGTLAFVSFTGCGSGKRPVSVTGSVAAATPPSTAALAATTSTPQLPAPNSATPPDFVLKAKSETGDRVSVEGRFGPALPLTRSDANQAAVGQCPLSDGRELVARLDLNTTIQSSLPGDVVLDQFRTDGLANGLTEFLMGYTDGPSCDTEDGADHRVDLGTLQPHAPHRFTIWVILDDAVTPNDPRPSARKLGVGWRMTIPTVAVDNGRTLEPVAGGPRVIQCSRLYGGQDRFIAVAGTVPTVITGLNDERLPCTAVRSGS